MSETDTDTDIGNIKSEILSNEDDNDLPPLMERGYDSDSDNESDKDDNNNDNDFVA